MSWFKLGQIVISKAGRDKDDFLVVVGEKDDFVLVADGKSRKIAKPKCKNKKHLQKTNEVIAISELTDKDLKKMLRERRMQGCFNHLKKGENTLVKR